MTDPRGFLRRVTFNANGYTASDTRAVGQPETQTTTLAWDLTKNLLQSVIDPLGRLTTYTYDSRGNVQTITRLADRPADAITTTLQYEPTYSRVTSIVPSQRTTDGQVTIAYTGLTQATITDARGKATAVTYNAVDQVRTVTDPLTQMTEFVYDSQGNLTDLYDPLRNRTARADDPVGRLVNQIDPRGRTTSFVYDLLNQLTVIGDGAGGATRFSYDPNGNLLSVTNARGNATTYHYDRLDQRTDPVTNVELFHYDKNGNVDQFTDRKGQVTGLSYDGLNRRTGVTSPGVTTTNTLGCGESPDASRRFCRRDDRQHLRRFRSPHRTDHGSRHGELSQTILIRSLTVEASSTASTSTRLGASKGLPHSETLTSSPSISQRRLQALFSRP